MARFNQVILLGHLTADPELKQTSGGTSVCSFNLAVNRKVAQEGTPSCDFIPCISWRSTAEFVSKYFKKGSPLLIKGELQVRSYTDKQGNKRTVTEVIVDEAFFVESKRSAVDAPEHPNPYIQAASSAQFEEVSSEDEGLPF